MKLINKIVRESVKNYAMKSEVKTNNRSHNLSKLDINKKSNIKLNKLKFRGDLSDSFKNLGLIDALASAN